MKKILTILLTSIAFISCLRKESHSNVEAFTKDSLIVFYNLTESSRSEIAKSLERIDSLGPKLIALEVIFEELRDPREDSVLSSSLRKLDNVVFSANVTSPYSVVERTNDFFKRTGSQEGVLSYIVSEDSTATEYVPLFENKQGQENSFPDVIVFNFRPETISRFKKMYVNQSKPVNFVKGLENFNIVDRESLAPEVIQDKIVIVGPLEHNRDDYFRIILNNRKIKTFTPVITANIILNILSEHKNNLQTTDH